MLLLKRFCSNKSGAVAMTATVAIPVLIGFVALVAEFGNGILVKSQTQRIADAAAYAAAVNYASTSSTTSMQAVAQNVALLNGYSSSSITASLVTSPVNASNQAVLVNMATSLDMIVAPVLGFKNTMPVSSNSYVGITTGTSGTGCMIALDSGGTGITMSGSASISASGCTVASNKSLTVPCGTSISATKVNYKTSSPTVGCSGITGTVSQTTTTDPYSSNASVQTSASRAKTSISDPSSPNISGGGENITFTWDDGTKGDLQSVGCTGTQSGSTWNVTCPSGGTYNFGTMTISWGITVNFVTSGSGTSIYNFSGPLINLGTAATFGSGTYNIKSGIYLGGGTSTTFSGGTFNVGTGSLPCGDWNYYSICHLGTSLIVTNASTFKFNSGIYVTGGATLKMGTSGSTNVFNLGSNNSGGNALKVGGGATATLGDATTFTVNGNLSQSGGSCLTLPASTYHDIDGNMNMMGGLTMGAGHYAVTGYFAAGASGGGDVSCNGSMIGLSANNVSMAVGGNSVISGGTCDSMSFCLGAGFSNVTIKAPTTGTFANLAVVGPQSSGSSGDDESWGSSGKGGCNMSEGSNNTLMSGLFYFPNGPLTISGSASIGNASGDSLSIVASQITLSGSGRATVGVGSGLGSSSSQSKTVGFVQ